MKQKIHKFNTYDISANYPDIYKKMKEAIDELIDLVKPETENDMFSLQAHINNTMTAEVLNKIIFGDEKRNRLSGWKLNENEPNKKRNQRN